MYRHTYELTQHTHASNDFMQRVRTRPQKKSVRALASMMTRSGSTTTSTTTMTRRVLTRTLVMMMNGSITTSTKMPKRPVLATQKQQPMPALALQKPHKSHRTRPPLTRRRPRLHKSPPVRPHLNQPRPLLRLHLNQPRPLPRQRTRLPTRRLLTKQQPRHRQSPRQRHHRRNQPHRPPQTSLRASQHPLQLPPTRTIEILENLSTFNPIVLLIFTPASSNVYLMINVTLSVSRNITLAFVNFPLLYST